MRPAGFAERGDACRGLAQGLKYFNMLSASDTMNGSPGSANSATFLLLNNASLFLFCHASLTRTGKVTSGRSWPSRDLSMIWFSRMRGGVYGLQHTHRCQERLFASEQKVTKAVPRIQDECAIGIEHPASSLTRSENGAGHGYRDLTVVTPRILKSLLIFHSTIT